MDCRHCRAPLTLSFVDLGTAPPSNSYLKPHDLAKAELWLPLRVLVCTHCWLVQTEDYAGADEIFTADYAYFSSFSSSWLEHARRYVAEVVDRFGLTRSSLVVELAANDGYLLQYMASRQIPCIGVEPTASTAAKAREKGIEVIEEFFGIALARKMAETSRRADLIVANNVLAHVPDINDFVSGIALLLQDDGVATFEFPHLVNLVASVQFDTIYHEHFSYLSFKAVSRIFADQGLSVFDVVELPTHGGSLRVYAQKMGGPKAATHAVKALLRREEDLGVDRVGYYEGFQPRVERLKDNFLRFLIDAKRDGKSIAGYGAAAKGSTLLNYAGIRSDLIPFVVDKSPSKIGKYLPGCRIPIVDVARIQRGRPDYVVVLPWNIRVEIETDLSYVRDWGGRFVTAVPELLIK